MSEIPLNVALIWHMHQPYYKDLRNDQYQMPWVRLHGIKDYYDMVAILDDYPQIHQTFNLVPSLIEQIEDYANQRAYDRHLFLTEKPASQLVAGEKEEIISNFFICNYETMIKPHPRFNQLFNKRGERVEDIKSVSKRFTSAEILDLQIWSNLAWVDPIFYKEKEIAYLLKKNQNFSEEDKRILIDKQREILSRILPKYKEAKDRGQVEITISPYYHPILPLLYDTNSAKVALSNIKLPKIRFSHPEDVEKQVQMGIELYERIFKDKPKGLWPSEGGVSEQIIPLLAKYGIKWIATDEEILYMSLLLFDKSKPLSASEKYKILHRAYTVSVNQNQLHIVFRDHILSDLIGFVYSKWEAKTAVKDFIDKLHRIREILFSDLENSLVSIILDGENCWEYYKNDGHDFLNLLYQELSNDKLLRTVKVSEFLEKSPQTENLPKLFAGSWINHNFRIWIGHPEDNLAWELLKMTRDALTAYQQRMGDKAKPEIIQKAWKAIYVAEGSDWCWWYGDEHQGPSNDQFDRLFRSHLLYVYELMEEEPPDILYKPIRSVFAYTRQIPPTGYIKPTLDGKNTHYYEWQAAGFFDCLKDGGSMHRATNIVKGIYYGLDEENLYFRVDTFLPAYKYIEDNYLFSLEILEPAKYILSMEKERQESKSGMEKTMQEAMIVPLQTGVGELIELAIPIKQMKFQDKKVVGFQVVVRKDKKELERWPSIDLIRFEIPSEKSDQIFWQI
jgi:alpha-amylase/alpha-mannosidase (GH57 family)